MGSGNPLSSLMHRMTVSNKPNKNNMTNTSAAKKNDKVVKRGQSVVGAANGTRSQSRKRPSAAEMELGSSEDEQVMVESGFDQRNGSYPDALPAQKPAQPRKRRSADRVQFQEALAGVPKFEDDERDGIADSAMKRKFSMHDFSATLKITTGSTQFLFEYSKTLLVRNSAFFKAACETNEFDPKLAFDFSEIEPSIFTIYLVWLASNNIENAKECIVVPDGLERKDLQQQSFQKRLQLIQLYVLGERLIDRSFKNQIMDSLVAHCRLVYEKFGPVDGLGNGARLVYEKTKSTSLLRRLVLENYFATGSFADCKPRAPGDRCDGDCAITEQFYLDLAKIGMRVVRERRAAPLPPWEQHKCYYHDHSDQDEGYTCNN